jgi:hypothetical protein
MPPTGPHPNNLAAAAVVIVLVAAMTVAGETEAKPTPSTEDMTGERLLGEYAGRICLDRSVLEESDGMILITNDTVGRISGQGRLTSGHLADRATNSTTGVSRKSNSGNGAKLRSHWRKLVDDERQKIADTQTELALLDSKIDSLEDAAFDGGPGAVRIWAKYEEARQRRRLIEHRLKRQRAKLAEVVREARRQGAQPGWFR